MSKKREIGMFDDVANWFRDYGRHPNSTVYLASRQAKKFDDPRYVSNYDFTEAVDSVRKFLVLKMRPQARIAMKSAVKIAVQRRNQGLPVIGADITLGDYIERYFSKKAK